MAVFQEFLNNIYHLGDMLRRPRCDLGPLVAEGVKIFPEVLDIRRRKFIDRDISCRGLLYDPVINICQVKNMEKLITLELQIAPQNVAENKGAEIADMREIPDGRPTNVHSYLTGFNRLKFLDLSR